jgi:hypothetical protein
VEDRSLVERDEQEVGPGGADEVELVGRPGLAIDADDGDGP